MLRRPLPLLLLLALLPFPPAAGAQGADPRVAALEAYGVLHALVAAVVSPVPHGPDGESEGGDPDFEEKVLRALHTYVGPCGRPLPAEERGTLGKWLDEQSGKAGGDAKVAERWALTVDEVRELKAATS